MTIIYIILYIKIQNRCASQTFEPLCILALNQLLATSTLDISYGSLYTGLQITALCEYSYEYWQPGLSCSMINHGYTCS